MQLEEDIAKCEQYLLVPQQEQSSPWVTQGNASSLPFPQVCFDHQIHPHYPLAPMNHFDTLIDLLQYRSQNQPSQTAYVFLQDGEVEVDRLNYRQLAQQAQAIAAHLQSLGAEGERALLLYPPGLEFISAFLGCLLASVTAVPAYPPRQNQNLHRLSAIVANAQAKFVLTTPSLLNTVQEQFAQSQDLASIHCLATEQISADLAQAWQKPQITGDSLAFLQYTSGSTGNPKGVMVSHSNLLHNEQIIQQGFGHTEASSVLGWLPVFHDMGLIGNVLQPLYAGIPCYLMAPVAFLQKPIRWLQAISRYKITTSGGSNFAYDLCVRKITDEQKANLDLSCWELAFSGAEMVRSETLERFAKAFAPCGFRREAFYPCYGMAETTLIVSGGLKTAAPVVQALKTKDLAENRIVSTNNVDLEGQSLVGCGQSLANLKIVIANPQTLTRCAADEVGEIWVSGPSVAQGYWQKPDVTQETFGAYLQDSQEGPFLRTGDLGFLQDGELFITGRIKDLIIIRGRNHYPQDIELTVSQAHHALQPDAVAAFSIEVAGDEKLVIVQEVERSQRRKLNVDEVVTAICREVALKHELQVYAITLISPGSIPKTSSGKIQRQACRKTYLDNGLNVLYTWQQASQEAVLSATSNVSLLPLETEINQESLRQKTEDSIPSVLDNLPKLTIVSPNQNQKSESLIGKDLSLRLPPKVGSQSKARADEMISWFRGYADKRINSQLIDQRRCIPPYIVLDLGNRGFLGMQIAEQYGGKALDTYDAMQVIQQVAAVDLTLASFVGVNHALGTRPIANFAQPHLKDKLLPLIAQGRELAAYAITEPGAGSHPKAIATTATPVAGGWHLRGEKMFIGSGSWAGIINVFAQLLDEQGKPLGITGFVVKQGAEGLIQGPESLTMGMRGMVQNSIYLNDVFVSPQDMLGTPGGGMDVAQDAMMFGRLGIGAMSIGGMKRCAQLMLRYASRRSIATGNLLENPVTLNRLNQLSASITAVETLVSRIAQLLDRGVSVPEEAYIACKIAGPEFLSTAADHLMQALGGRGYLENNIAPQLLRDARLMRIFEGPTETLNMFLGSRLLNQSEPLDRFLSETLGTPRIVTTLHSAAQQIYDLYHSKQSPFSDRTTTLRWVYSLVGELTTFAILQAALESLPVQFQSLQSERAIHWLKLNFDNLLHQALVGNLSEIANAEAMTAEIGSYASAIGDLEQTLAGEDQQLDPYLQKSPTSAEQKPQAVIAASVALESSPVYLAKSVASVSTPITNTKVLFIEKWIIDWLSQNLKIPLTSLIPSQAFAEYGLDSVMAVELVQDLETWLNQPLDPTVIWNYSTIEALAKYAASLTPNSIADKPTQITTQLAEEVAQLNHYSEAKATAVRQHTESEIALLLAEEITKSQQASWAETR